MRLLFDATGNEGAEPYGNLLFPVPPADRPYVLCNMVETLDGKIVNDKTAKGLGSPEDRALMQVLRRRAEAVLIGAGTLRTDPKAHYSLPIVRATITSHGVVPADHPFFTEMPERTVLFLSDGAKAPSGLPIGVRIVSVTDILEALRYLRDDLGIDLLLCEGGAQLNGSLIRADALDELFLTLAPKLRGGEGPPIIMAEPWPSFGLPTLNLLSVWEHEGELFLRYRV